MPEWPRPRIRRAATAAAVVLASATLLVSARLLSPVAAPAPLRAGAGGSSPAAVVVGASRPDSGACAGAAHRHFDFWRGSWEVRADGDRVGRNEIRVVAGGCGLEEAWRGADGGRGRSLNYYDPADGRWHQLWLGSGGRSSAWPAGSRGRRWS